MYILLLFAHFLGDFVLQSREMAMNKSSKLLFNLKHISLVLLPLLPIAYWYQIHPLKVLMYGILHGLQDWFIWPLFKKIRTKTYDLDKKSYKPLKDYWFIFTLGLDQFLHLIILFTLFSGEIWI